jgi:hypothetical protein
MNNKRKKTDSPRNGTLFGDILENWMVKVPNFGELTMPPKSSHWLRCSLFMLVSFFPEKL